MTVYWHSMAHEERTVGDWDVKKLRTDNEYLRARLKQVSSALLSSMESAAAAGETSGTADQFQSGARRFTDGKRGRIIRGKQTKLQKLHQEIHELHRQNQVLHRKSDSLWLTKRVRALEHVLETKGKQEEELHALIQKLKAANYKMNKQLESLSEGSGQFARDFKTLTMESAAMEVKIKEATLQKNRLDELRQKQERKIGLLTQEIGRTGRDMSTVKQNLEEIEVIRSLKSEGQKLRKQMDILKHAERTGAAMEEQTAKDDAAQIAALAEEVDAAQRQLQRS